MKRNNEHNRCKQDVAVFFKFLLSEISFVLTTTFILCMLDVLFAKNLAIIDTLERMYLAFSLAAMCYLGRELFGALDQNRWNLRKTNNDVMVVTTISLIVLNAATCPFMLHSDRRFIILIIPGIIWILTIVESRIKRWWKL